VLQSYLPVLVFAGLGLAVGGALVAVNRFLGPRRPNKVKSEPYECGLPSEVSKTFRFGVSFYMVAMLFILFDIEVVFLYPVGAILQSTESVFVLAEILIFVFLLFVALVYVWRRGALDWK
jgi:NADH-quinone oxidoreductase subunit A